MLTSAGMLDDRKAAILRVLVEEHVRTGSPVSSRSILDHSSLMCSSATIRNDLVILERDGLIEKPHSSAGRVPTDRGYRYYIDHLSPGSLRQPTRHRIEEFFASIHAELNRLLKETSELLSEITNYPSIVLGPGLAGATVRDARLVPLEAGVVLLVLVTDGGRVTQTMLRSSVPATPAEIERVQEVLTDTLHGIALAPGAADRLDLDELATELPPPALDLVEAVYMAISGAAKGEREVYVGGTSHLLSLWEDMNTLHRILGLLDHEAGVLGLLGADSDQTTVRIGRELEAGEDDLAVISTRYEIGSGAGRMGLLGPMRMDYKRNIKVVEEVSDALTDQSGA